MDPRRFDSLVRTLPTGRSRRRLLGVLSVLPLVGTALAGDQHPIASQEWQEDHHHRRRTEAGDLVRVHPVLITFRCDDQ